jgi:hypothetical protein
VEEALTGLAVLTTLWGIVLVVAWLRGAARQNAYQRGLEQAGLGLDHPRDVFEAVLEGGLFRLLRQRSSLARRPHADPHLERLRQRSIHALVVWSVILLGPLLVAIVVGIIYMALPD